MLSFDLLWDVAALILFVGLAIVVATGVAFWWRPVAAVMLDLAATPVQWLVRCVNRAR